MSQGCALTVVEFSQSAEAEARAGPHSSLDFLGAESSARLDRSCPDGQLKRVGRATRSPAWTEAGAMLKIQDEPRACNPESALECCGQCPLFLCYLESPRLQCCSSADVSAVVVAVPSPTRWKGSLVRLVSLAVRWGSENRQQSEGWYDSRVCYNCSAPVAIQKSSP